ncbi:MAG: DUF6069 family protein [bacterium]|nr:DUF6069 family protein [bacterium]
MTTATQVRVPTTFRSLLGIGAVAGALAAFCTTMVAAIANAAGVSLEVGGEQIPVAAFAFWTLAGSAIGIVLAQLLRDRRRFVVVTLAITGLSLIPAVALADDNGTKVILVGCHVVAAAILIPALGSRLTTAETRSQAGLQG